MLSVRKVTVVAHSAAAMLLEMPAKRRLVLLEVISLVLIGRLMAIAAEIAAAASSRAPSHLLGRARHVLGLESGVHGRAHHLGVERLGHESYLLDARLGFTLLVERIEGLARVYGHHARHGHHERHLLLLLLRELHGHLSLLL